MKKVFHDFPITIFGPTNVSNLQPLTLLGHQSCLSDYMKRQNDSLKNIIWRFVTLFEFVAKKKAHGYVESES